MNSENLDVTESEWVASGPDRFYFNQAYDAETQSFEDLPLKAAFVGSKGKVGVIYCSILSLLLLFPYYFVLKWFISLEGQRKREGQGERQK